jgi:hypothetical protein
MYDNMDLLWTGSGLNCRLRLITGTYLRTSFNWGSSKPPGILGHWTHVGCSFNPSTLLLSLWVNGTLLSQVPFTAGLSDFQHGQYMAIGLGNRPFSSFPLQGFNGSLDDFALWKRPLLASEWKGIALSATGLTAFRGIGFTSNKFINITTFHSISVAIFPPSAASSVQISVSTDSGAHFCPIVNGQVISMLSQGKTPGNIIFCTKTNYNNISICFFSLSLSC